MVAAAVGGGGGYALGPIADSLAANTVTADITNIGAVRLKITGLEGDVRLLAPDGAWRPTRVGEAAARPTGLSTVGLSSVVKASLASHRLTLGKEGRALIGDEGRGGTTVQLDQGHLLIENGRTTTYVPARALRVVGTDYGVWVAEDRVVVSVVEGEVEITHRGEATKYAGGREILFTRQSTSPRAMDPELSISIVDKARRGRRTRITAQTTPAGFAFQKNDGAYQPVDVQLSGRLTVLLRGEEPAPGEVVVYDAAGRSAQLGGPATPDAMKATLAGQEKERDEIQPRPRPSKKPKPRPKARRRVEPLVKPEAKPPKLDRSDLPPVEETLAPPPEKEAKKAKKPRPEPVELPDPEEDEEIDESDL